MIETLWKLWIFQWRWNQNFCIRGTIVFAGCIDIWISQTPANLPDCSKSLRLQLSLRRSVSHFLSLTRVTRVRIVYRWPYFDKNCSSSENWQLVWYITRCITPELTRYALFQGSAKHRNTLEPSAKPRDGEGPDDSVARSHINPFSVPVSKLSGPEREKCSVLNLQYCAFRWKSFHIPMQKTKQNKKRRECLRNFKFRAFSGCFQATSWQWTAGLT